MSKKTQTPTSSTKTAPKKKTVAKKAPALKAAPDRTAAYAEDVCSGKIIAGPHVRNACRRHLDDLKNGKKRGLFYDAEAAQRVFDFFEKVLRLSDGQFDDRPFFLHPSQAFKLGCLFGWKKKDGTRRFRRAYIEEGKGNGKTPLAAGIGLYGLAADGEAGAQIYAAASNRQQANIMFSDAVKMVRRSPALLSRLQFSGGMGKEYNIAYHPKQSFFKTVSREGGRSGSGYRPHIALCDEVHEQVDRRIIEMLERGFKFRRNPLLLMITNSGTDRNSICFEEHQHAVKVAAGTLTPDDDFAYVGEVIDDTTFSYVCAMDKGDDPLNDPSCWIKANPLLGITITDETLRLAAAQALQLPAKQNNTLRLHFCTWTDADQTWMSRAALEEVLDDFDPRDFAGSRLYIGVDLSATQDLTALGFMIQTGTTEMVGADGKMVTKPTYHAWAEAFTPDATIVERSARDKVPYDVWAKTGKITATSGNLVRMDFLAARIAELQTQYQIPCIAYDAYAFRKNFEPELDAAGVTAPLVEHPQGGKRRAPPTEAQKEAAEREDRVAEGLWMPGSVTELETLILEKRITIATNPATISAFMGAVLEQDAFGNRWFSKRKATMRIDPLVADEAADFKANAAY